MIAKKTSRETGFTLIEIMVVIAIVGLMVGMGIYTYLSQIPQINIRNDAREINQTLQMAKMRSIASGMDHGVVFNLDDGRYFIFIDCDNDQEYDCTSVANFDNNAPVGTWEACEAATYDPRISEKGVLQLKDTNLFINVFGTTNGLEYVLFNNLGQAYQGSSNNFISGPAPNNTITIQTDGNSGRTDEVIIEVTGPTGLTDIGTMHQVP